MSFKKRLAFLASQSGTTFEAVTHACRQKRIPADPVLVITNNPQALVLEKADRLRVPHLCVNPKDYKTMAAWDQALAEALLAVDPHFILLAGFLRKLGASTLHHFAGRILNTHPSLLPKYGGHGMYGRRVHEAVIAQKEKVTGVSLHLVTENYDEGRVLKQKEIAVDAAETAENLEARVKKMEKEFLIEALGEIFAAAK